MPSMGVMRPRTWGDDMPDVASLLELKEDLELLKALGTVAKAWREKAEQVDDLPGLVELLKLAAKDVDDEKTKTAFAKIGAEDQLEKIGDLLKKVIGEVTDPRDDPYVRLASRVSRFNETTGVKDQGQVAWTPLDRELEFPLSDQFGAKLKAGATVSFEAGAAWSFAGDEELASLLGFEVKADFSAGLSGKAPFKAGSVSASTSLSSTGRLEFYYDLAGSDPLMIEAVADKLAVLPNPFDFDSVRRGFSRHQLVGLVYHFDGAASLEVEVQLASALKLGKALDTTLGAKISVGVDVRGDHTLSFRLDPKSDRATPQILAVLSRTNKSGFTGGLSLGLEIDLSKLAGRVHEALQEGMNVWADALEDLRPYLSPGTLLQKQGGDTIEDVVGKILGEGAFREALIRDLQGMAGIGVTDDVAVRQWLEKALVEAVESSGVLTGVKDQSGRIVDQLGNRLPAFAQARFKAHLTDAVEDAVTKLNELLDEVVRKLVGPQNVHVANLGAQLKTVGENAKTVFATLDDAFAGVRRFLDRYDALFKKVLAETQNAARQKISARMAFEEVRDKNASYQVAGTLVTETQDAYDDAKEVFKSLVSGDLAPLLERFRGAKSPGFLPRPEKSSIRRFASRKDELSYDIVVLGFGVKGSQLLLGDATVQADGAGGLRIDATGRVKAELSTPWESRDVSFVDVYNVRLLRSLKGAPSVQDRALELGVSINHRDKSLKRDEVLDFVKSLQDAELVPLGTHDKGVQAFNHWRLKGDNKAIQADISAKLWLTGASAVAVLGQRGDGHLTGAAATYVRNTALYALYKAKGFDYDKFSRGAEIAKRHDPTTVDDDIYKIVFSYKLPQAPHLEPVLDSPVDRVPLDYFRGQFADLAGLANDAVAMIDKLGAIYDAEAADPFDEGAAGGGKWSEQSYLDAEHAIAKSASSWVKVNGRIFWVASAVHPRTAALMRTLVRLAEAEKKAPVTVSITYRPDGKTPETVVLA